VYILSVSVNIGTDSRDVKYKGRAIGRWVCEKLWIFALIQAL